MARIDSRARRDSVALALQDAAWAAANKPPPGFAYLIKDASDGVVKLLLSDGTFVNLQAGGGGGGAPTTATYITQTPDAGLSAEQAMSLLPTGLVKNATATGVQSIATAGTDYVPGGDWFNGTAVPQMRAAVSALTAFEYCKTGIFPPGAGVVSAPAIDPATVVGGAIGMVSDATWQRFTTTIFTAPKTAPWAICFRGKTPAPTSGKLGSFALANTGLTHQLGLAVDFSVSATKFVLRVVGGADVSVASTLNADTSVHDFMIFSDTATGVKLSVDGTVVATQASYAQVSDEGMSISVYSNASLTPGLLVYKFAFGYVAP